MTTATDTVVAQAAALLLRSKSGIAFTGAGVSVESGIPHFRGEGGLWTKIDPYKVAHIDTFRKDPSQYWTYSLNHRRTDAEPNPAHRALVELERLGLLRAVTSQNTDPTPFDEVASAVIHGKAGEVLPEIVRRMGTG